MPIRTIKTSAVTVAVDGPRFSLHFLAARAPDDSPLHGRKQGAAHPIPRRGPLQSAGRGFAAGRWPRPAMHPVRSIKACELDAF